jgi:hypothetical protein
MLTTASYKLFSIRHMAIIFLPPVQECGRPASQKGLRLTTKNIAILLYCFRRYSSDNFQPDSSDTRLQCSVSALFSLFHSDLRSSAMLRRMLYISRPGRLKCGSAERDGFESSPMSVSPVVPRKHRWAILSRRDTAPRTTYRYPSFCCLSRTGTSFVKSGVFCPSFQFPRNRVLPGAWEVTMVPAGHEVSSPGESPTSVK